MIEAVDAVIGQYLILWDGHASGLAGWVEAAQVAVLHSRDERRPGREEADLDEAMRRSSEDLKVGDVAMLSSTDDALCSVLDGGPERRRVMRRVGQGQHSRRLRRGNTLTTLRGHAAVDVPVSHGLLRWDSSPNIAC